MTRKKFKVVCFIRVDSEVEEPLSYEEAKRERENSKFMQPENVYRIEAI